MFRGSNDHYREEMYGANYYDRNPCPIDDRLVRSSPSPSFFGPPRPSPREYHADGGGGGGRGGYFVGPGAHRPFRRLGNRDLPPSSPLPPVVDAVDSAEDYLVEFQKPTGLGGCCLCETADDVAFLFGGGTHPREEVVRMHRTGEGVDRRDEDEAFWRVEREYRAMAEGSGGRDGGHAAATLENLLRPPAFVDHVPRDVIWGGAGGSASRPFRGPDPVGGGRGAVSGDKHAPTPSRKHNGLVVKGNGAYDGIITSALSGLVDFIMPGSRNDRAVRGDVNGVASSAPKPRVASDDVPRRPLDVSSSADDDRRDGAEDSVVELRRRLEAVRARGRGDRRVTERGTDHRPLLRPASSADGSNSRQHRDGVVDGTEKEDVTTVRRRLEAIRARGWRGMRHAPERPPLNDGRQRPMIPSTGAATKLTADGARASGYPWRRGGAATDKWTPIDEGSAWNASARYDSRSSRRGLSRAPNDGGFGIDAYGAESTPRRLSSLRSSPRYEAAPGRSFRN